MKKRDLYESIMRTVSRTVKKSLDEAYGYDGQKELDALDALDFGEYEAQFELFKKNRQQYYDYMEERKQRMDWLFINDKISSEEYNRMYDQYLDDRAHELETWKRRRDLRKQKCDNLAARQRRKEIGASSDLLGAAQELRYQRRRSLPN